MIKTISLAFLITVFVFISTRTAYAAPGDLDQTFGVGGRVITPGLSAHSVAIQPDGKIVTAGSLDYGSIVLARYTPDGVLDPTFDGDGIVFALAPGFQCTIALSPSGKIVVAVSDKSGRVSPPITFVLLRFNSNGSVDTTFDGDGIITPSFTGFPNASSYNVAVQPDGKIISVGFVRDPSHQYKSAVARFNDDGSIDTSFSVDGLAVGSSFEDFNSAVTIQPGGKILAAGSASFGNSTRFAVSRYNVDGSADTSFNSVGYATADLAGHANDVVIQPDGKIVVAGFDNYDFGLARFNGNGSLDNSFDYDGKVTTPFGGYEHGANAVAIQPDGKIVAGGSHRLFDEETWEWHYFGIDLARYNNDGSLDTSFSGDGRVSNSLGAGYYAADFAIRSDGRIVAAGFHSGVGLLLARYYAGGNTPFDYDGDGRADLSVRRPSNNIWYLLRGTAGYTAMQYGVAGDRMTPSDYDGDGKTDVSIFRPSNGTWYMFMSQSQTFQTFGWGQNGDLPVPTDRDNDGKTDLVIFRPSNNTWYTRFANGTFHQAVFGQAGDKPVVGDFDADGIGDIALFRPSNNNWYIIKSSLGFFIQTWGLAGDIPTTGDFDGDGATDQAVFRPSTGQWYLSQTSAGFSVRNWGQNGDVPVAADYDGDGKTDVAIFRPSNSTWYIVNSTAGILVQQFGQNGDVPTPSAFNY